MSAPRFSLGQRVRIADRAEPRHHRVPAYVKGRAGTVQRVCLPQPRPEVVGYADEDELRLPVYRVRLAQTALWPRYQGRPEDSLEIEIFEHWLEPLDAGEVGQPSGATP